MTNRRLPSIYAASVQDGGWNEAFDGSKRARSSRPESLGAPIAFSESIPEEASGRPSGMRSTSTYERGFNIPSSEPHYGYSDGILQAADDQPDVAFLNAAGDHQQWHEPRELLAARTYEGWYLAGLIAGTRDDAAGPGS